MPWNEPEEDRVPLPSTMTGVDVPNPTVPSRAQTVVNAFLSENPVVSLIARMSQEQYPPEDGHNPLDVLRGTKHMERDRDIYLGSQSTAETKAIMRRVEEEDARREQSEAAGTFGTIAAIGAGIFSPEMALPAGSIIRGVRTGRGIAKSAASVGVASTGQAGLAEGLLQMSQETRTLGESALAVGSATLLGAFIGGGASAALPRGEFKALTRTFEMERRAIDAHAAGQKFDPVAEGRVLDFEERVEKLKGEGFTVEGFHGTNKPFEEFDDTKLGANTGSPSARQGFFFSKGPDTAGSYIRTRWSPNHRDMNPEQVAQYDALHSRVVAAEGNPALQDTLRQAQEDILAGIKARGPLYDDDVNIRPAFLKMQNPFEHDFKGAAYRETSYNDLIIEAKAKGHDSAIFRNTTDGGPVDDIYVVFSKDQIAPRFAEERVAVSTPASASLPSAAGAAAADTRQLEPVGFLFDKIPGWSRIARHIGTDLGIYSSKSVVGRRTASEMFETALRFKQNVERKYTDPVTGEVRTIAAEVTSPVVPLDREVRTHIEMARVRTGDELKRLYSDHYFGEEGVTAPYLRAELRGRFGDNSGKLSPAEFDKEIISAMNRGDAHDVPQVAAAAQYIRKNVLDPWAEKMEKANPDFKRMEFGEGESYFPFHANNAKIAAERPDFVEKAILPHLQADQANKAAIKERLSVADDELQTSSKAIGNFEAQLERLAARQSNLESRLDERAMEVRRAGGRVDTLEGRSATIAEEISEIEEFVAAMRKEVQSPELRARLDTLEQDAKDLRAGDRPVTEANLRAIEQEELKSILTGTTRMAAEMVVGQRKFPKAPSFITWLVTNGGVKDTGGDVGSVVGGKRVRHGLINEKGRSLDEIGEKIWDEFPAAFPDGRPLPNEVLDFIDSAMRGREPQWWINHLSPDKRDLLDAGRLAAGWDEIFNRAGIKPKSIHDVAKVLRDDRTSDVKLADLDRIAADMEAAGESIPVSLRRADIEEQVAVSRETITEIRGVIADAINARGARERRLSKAEAVSAEAGLAERANRGRIGILDEQMTNAEKRRELITDALEIANRQRDDIRGRMEADLGAWGGKSADEAKSALKTREKADAARSPEAKAAKPRLESADSAIESAVKRILKSDRDLSIEDLRAKAEEITNHYLGTPIGRIPYDIASTAAQKPRPPGSEARGPLQARDFNIPYALMKDWLSDDLNATLGAYMRTMVPDTLLFERFKGEGPAMTSRYRAIEDEYVGLVREAPTAKERTRLNTEKDQVIAALDGVLQRIRGTTNNVTGMSGRVGEAVRRVNQMTDLGFAAVTSIPDFAGPIFAHGFASTFADGWGPFARYLGGDGELAKMSKTELRGLGIAIDIENSTRGHAMAEINETYNPHTQTERALKHASDRFFLLNLQSPETEAAKRIAGRTAMANIMRAIKAEVDGKATARQVAMLRESNIDASLSRRIWGEFDKPDGGSIHKGFMLTNTDNWTDANAKMHFAAALGRDVDRSVVTPGQEKPLWLSSNVGSLLGQYKSFSMSATTKILISNLQRADAQSLQGAIGAVALGVLSYRLSTLLRGQPWPERPQDAIKEGISRSGLMGIMEDVNMFAAKATSGSVDIYRAIGADKPLSRNANRTILSNLLGPTAGKIEGIAKITGAAGRGEWGESDTHALRRLIMLQNLVGLNKAFDAVEAGTNGLFGIEMKPRP